MKPMSWSLPNKEREREREREREGEREREREKDGEKGERERITLRSSLALSLLHAANAVLSSQKWMGFTSPSLPGFPASASF